MCWYRWYESEALDAFKRQEFSVSFATPAEYQLFYIECRAAGLDYRPDGFYSKPDSDDLMNSPVKILVYYHEGTLRWYRPNLRAMSECKSDWVMPYSELSSYSAVADPVPIPQSVLSEIISQI